MFGEIFTAVGASFTIKDVVGPVIGGLLGWAGAHYTARMNAKVAHEATEEKAKEAAVDFKVRAEAAQVDSFVKRELAQSENLTARFKLLMDGYENQIESLTSEVSLLRTKVEALQKSYEDHRLRCATCPHFQSKLADAAD